MRFHPEKQGDKRTGPVARVCRGSLGLLLVNLLDYQRLFAGSGFAYLTGSRGGCIGRSSRLLEDGDDSIAP